MRENGTSRSEQNKQQNKQARLSGENNMSAMAPVAPQTRMKRWGLRVIHALLILLSLLACVVTLAYALGNRPVASPTLAQRQAHLARAIDWVVQNEATLLEDTNSALWQMVAVTANLTGDARLHAIVQRANKRIFPEGRVHSPWIRMVLPQAQVDPTLISPSELEGYQLDFLSALTCGATEPIWSTSDQWRLSHQCRPLWRNMTIGDRACSTHQLMVLNVLKRMGCHGMPVAPALEDELIQDIRWLLRADPLMKDVYIQRVLMLMWTRGEGVVEPVWLQRVMDAQQSDGGWMWRLQIPEAPTGMDLWDFHRWLSRHWPGIFNPNLKHTDFHASAQGLLLMALAVRSAQQAQGDAGVPSVTPAP
jgi:hypothetical protein